METFVITAAGGNPTAIRKIQVDLTRNEYEKFGKELMSKTENYGVEQAGFLIHRDNSISHFEMSGGEFCGNAARSAGLVLSLETGKNFNQFTISGFNGTVSSYVEKKSEINKFNVRCEFPKFVLGVKKVLSNFGNVSVVDLGGIVHIVIEGKLPSNYKEIHNKITNELKLNNRDAVGVIWVEKGLNKIAIEPIVWVKSINTFFHETSCGSGTIAVAKVFEVDNVIQPSGGIIKATISNESIKLESEMEIVYEENVSVNIIPLDHFNDDKYKDKFISLYKEAFGGAPYFESYDDSWVEENIWKFHLKNGCIFVALHKNDLVGLSCAIPLNLEKKVFDFLVEKKLPFDPTKTLYMSELAVSAPLRKSQLHIGSELVKKRIEWGKVNGFKSYIMRTAVKNSNSAGLYERVIGSQKLKFVQNVSEEEILSSSNERMFFYGNIN